MDIEIKKLKKQYNNQIVLDIDSLFIPRGELIGLIGNNGAGKTTLLRLISDLSKATSGRVLIKGNDVSRSEAWKQYTSSYIDKNFLIDFLTAEEYFEFIAASYNISKHELDLSLASLADFMRGELLNKNKYIRDHSIGNQQKIGIIAAIISNPDILVLDEPFNYLDPTSQHFICNYLKNLDQNKGATMIISSHNLELIYDVSSRIILLDSGRVIKDVVADNTEQRDEINTYFKV